MTPLDQLTARVKDDLARIAHPDRPWVPPRTGPDGAPVLDVLIVGGGQCGMTTAFALLRAQVTNILVVEKAPRGLEGPWLTYARMPTLRSPKEFTGPDLDIPSLTYQSWHEAKYGEQHWNDLFRITREDWVEYLLWVRDALALPVQNETEVLDIAPAGELIAVTLRQGGATRLRYARKVVLATGQESMGRWTMPDFLKSLPATLRAHSAEAIDFEALRGKKVAVLGAGASAFDNAATALEAGAAEVHLFCRREAPQLVQPYLWLTFRGFLRHLSDLDDAWRWRFMSYILGLREGFPQPTWDRCAKHANFALHAGAPWLGARTVDGQVEIDTPQGPFRADYAICATGIEMAPETRPELSRFAANIATWGDRYTPPETERNARLSRYPYLGPDYALQEKVAGQTPWIANIHLFSIAATVSFGASGSSINAMTTAVPKLADGITRALFREDVEAHWASLRAYDIEQAELRIPEPA